MSRISQTIKNLISGISQQPNILRLPEQLEEQINGFSTESAGLQKRPPTLYVQNLGKPPSNENSLVHVVNRDENEKYIMLFNGSGVQVWDEYGNAKTVKYEGSGKSYITTNNPRRDLRIVTIADYTFIVNRTKTVKMSNDVVPFHWDDHSCLINVKSGQYGRTYRIKINGSEIASYTTYDGSDPADSKHIDTNAIRDELASKASANGWRVEKYNSCLWLQKDSVTINKVTCDDGFNGTAMFGFLHTTQKFTNLPSEARDGYTVEVLGDDGSESDNYYVSYSAEENVWKECAKPGIKAGYDASTMPHVMVRNADGTFTVKEAEWDDRKTGDDDSNPEPSFVGQTINDVFLFRNRLGLLAGENVILSKSASFFDFWVASAVEVQDTDPIDNAVSDNKVCILYHAIPFNQDLVLFSSDTQFTMSADGVLTPQNASAPMVTSFSSDYSVAPVSAGRRIYYITKRALYSTVREYYTMNDTMATKDSQDITSHIPSYIPNGVFAIYPCSNENLMMIISSEAPDTLYIYKYLFTEEARMQSSWSRWVFKGAEIIGGGFINSDFYMLIKRGGKMFMEKMIFTYNTKDYDDEPYRVYLDRKAVSSAIDDDNYDDINNTTHLDIKSAYGSLTDGASYGVVTPDGHYYEWDYDDVNNNHVEVPGDLRGQKLTFGEVYEFYVELSEIMIKRHGNSGTVAEDEGRLQLTRMKLNFNESGYFEVHVDHNDPRPSNVYYHTARVLGSGVNKTGELPFATGDMLIPIMSLNTNCRISIQSKAPTAVALIGYTWEGNYVKRTRSI